MRSMAPHLSPHQLPAAPAADSSTSCTEKGLASSSSCSSVCCHGSRLARSHRSSRGSDAGRPRKSMGGKTARNSEWPAVGYKSGLYHFPRPPVGIRCAIAVRAADPGSRVPRIHCLGPCPRPPSASAKVAPARMRASLRAHAFGFHRHFLSLWRRMGAERTSRVESIAREEETGSGPMKMS
jgi:hypothetical protein